MSRLANRAWKSEVKREDDSKWREIFIQYFLKASTNNTHTLMDVNAHTLTRTLSRMHIDTNTHTQIVVSGFCPDRKYFIFIVHVCVWERQHQLEPRTMKLLLLCLTYQRIQAKQFSHMFWKAMMTTRTFKKIKQFLKDYSHASTVSMLAWLTWTKLSTDQF